MCKFLSAIYHKQKGLLWDAYTDSHEDLVNFYSLNDTKDIPDFVRVEFYPDDFVDYVNAEKYLLHIDEQNVPVWFNEELQKQVVDDLRSIINRVIIKDKKIKCLLSGVYILCGNTQVDYIKNCRVFIMTDKANVGVMWESSNVGVMRESSNVGEMWGSSNVGVMRESSKVIKDNR